MSDLFNEEYNGAKFSDDRKHRLALWRIWDTSLPMVMFIGLNPSTANEYEPDNTITKVTKIAKHNGFGGFYMMNLFTFISTNPDLVEVKGKHAHHHHPDFDLKAIAQACEVIVFAWGNFKVFGRDLEVKKMFPNAKALHINKNGSPKHPLYCKDDSKLIDYVF